MALVREGLTLSLAVDANTVPAIDHPDPYEFEMLGIGADRISVAYHGMADTHIDAMAYWEDDGTYYNGYTPDPEAVPEQRHQRNSIHNLRDGILIRGVLIDTPRLKGLLYPGPTTPVYIKDLEAWEERAGVRVSVGDALFLGTGVWARREAEGPWLLGRWLGSRRCARIWCTWLVGCAGRPIAPRTQRGGAVRFLRWITGVDSWHSSTTTCPRLPVYRILSAHTEIWRGTRGPPGEATLMLVGAIGPSGLHLNRAAEPARMFQSNW